ncbi:NUDIX hydrolase [bacterium]|nr:NUDIX hydrolase [bacterium]
MSGYEFKPQELKLRAACVLIDDGKILLARHKRGEKEYWTLPGGGLEKGERIVDCLKRELWEESGLKIEVGEILFVFDVIEPERHVVTIVFRARKIGGEFKPKNVPIGPRLVGMNFIPLGKIKEIELIPPLGEEIEKSLNRPGVPYLGDLWKG